ncbi:MAG: IS66 family transposase [Alphaproteobacteria bacterium]|nr:MAG: IS66 family transposase [Alphaproteobacteria bacterium]
MPLSPDQLPDDPQALKQIIAAMAQDAIAAQAEIAKLRFQLARYRRAEFGRSSEKLAHEAEQLELAIEALEADQPELLATASPSVATAIESAVEAQKPARRPLPEQLPREDVLHAAPCTCPNCGGALRRIGEDITETLDYVPGRFKVIRHIREKLSRRSCDNIVAAPAPDHAIARGRAGAGLLAHIVVSKYDDHLPLYRQAEIFARQGINLETSTLSGWVGATSAALAPLIDALAADVMASDTLHVDDTPVPVLAPGTGKTKTGRLWTYVRDERPFAGTRPPAALFFYSPDRKGEHPQAHLKEFRGTIHADGYAGFNELFAGDRIFEAACWAHVRRKFFDVYTANGSPIAKEALERIGRLYQVEKEINGRVPDHRRRERQKRSKPIAAALAAWADETRRNLSRKSELAAAFRYMRARWTALMRCFDDGRLALDNNPAERALRCIAIGRKNYLFAGSDAGGRRAAAMYSLIESAKLNGVNPQHYLADVLTRIADHPARRIDELLPSNWQPANTTRAAA